MVLGAPAKEPLPSPSDNFYFPPIRNRELKKHTASLYSYFSAPFTKAISSGEEEI